MVLIAAWAMNTWARDRFDSKNDFWGNFALLIPQNHPFAPWVSATEISGGCAGYGLYATR